MTNTDLMEILTLIRDQMVGIGQDLTKSGYEYRNLYDFVIREGRDWPVRPHEYPMREKRECFNNAILDAVLYDIRYCEGYALSADTGSLPIHHAWCIDDDGFVVDTTWDPSPDHAYRGVIFDAGDAFQYREKGCTILDNWIDDLPVLKTRYDYATYNKEDE